MPVEIRGLGLGAGHVGHTRDRAVGWAWVLGQPRRLEAVRGDIGCKKKSRGSFEEWREIIT